MAKQKYYVVWKGREIGVFENWDECKSHIEGYQGAVYKSFTTKEAAIDAFGSNSSLYIGKVIFNSELSEKELQKIGSPILESISVDGAWNTSTGLIEYQGVYTRNKEIVFKQGPFYDGTNNVAEFLAIVHALAYCKSKEILLPIYSDSKNAISWVNAKKARTKLLQTSRNSILFELMSRAESWLKENKYESAVLKWETKAWGENPADFNRK